MQEAQYRIVFKGELESGMNQQTVKENLAALFKTDTGKIDKLFGGEATVLKRRLTRTEADKYLAALQRAGAKAHKAQEQPARELSLVQVHEDTANPTDQTVVGTMECPKCGHVQERASICQACGIVFDKYLARQSLLQQNMPSAAAPPNSPYAPPAADVDEALPLHGELKPLSVSGRIGRLRYLAWSMVIMFAGAGLFGLAAIIMAMSPTAGLVCMALAGVAIAVVSVLIGVQRLHDFGWSGWLILLNLVPVIGSLFPFAMLLVPGTREANRYGSPPPPNSRAVKLLAALWLVLILVGVAALPTLLSLSRETG